MPGMARHNTADRRQPVGLAAIGNCKNFGIMDGAALGFPTGLLPALRAAVLEVLRKPHPLAARECGFLAKGPKKYRIFCQPLGRLTPAPYVLSCVGIDQWQERSDCSWWGLPMPQHGLPISSPTGRSCATPDNTGAGAAKLQRVALCQPYTAWGLWP